MLSIAKSARISPLAHIEQSKLGTRIEIGENVFIDSFVRINPIGGRGDVIIGSDCDINSGTVIFTGNGITMGNNVLIAPNCTFAPTNHAHHSREKPIREQGFLPSKGGIVIEDDVWIGSNCTILDGAVLRKGCVIGAGSLVRGEVEAFSIQAGNPLHKIGMRGENLADACHKGMMDYNPDFARYYAILTQHKDYVGEVACLRKVLKKEGLTSSGKILSVGCGTGAHERLLAQNYAVVHGVDKSPSMIEYGNKENNLNNLFLSSGDLSQLETTGFDCAISLFNVVNCIETLEELRCFYSDIAQRLTDNGLLLFEVWNANETRKNPPTIVTREYRAGEVFLKRTCSPKMCSQKHQELTYDVTGRDGGRDVAFSSVHNIFLHSIPEIEEALRASGFAHFEWCSALSEGMKPMEANDRMLLCKARK